MHAKIASAANLAPRNHQTGLFARAAERTDAATTPVPDDCKGRALFGGESRCLEIVLGRRRLFQLRPIDHNFARHVLIPQRAKFFVFVARSVSIPTRFRFGMIRSNRSSRKAPDHGRVKNVLARRLFFKAALEDHILAEHTIAQRPTGLVSKFCAILDFLLQPQSPQPASQSRTGPQRPASNRQRAPGSRAIGS